MTFKSEYKPLNATGQEALRFWETTVAETEFKTHKSFQAMRVLNSYFKSKNMSAQAFVGTMPKNNNIALLIYSGQDADFDFEGRVEWNDAKEFSHLIEALEILNINCDGE